MPITCYNIAVEKDEKIFDEKAFFSSEEVAAMWGVSERSVRNYCALGRVPGAVLEGKTWLIPNGAAKPARERRHSTKSLKNETVLARLLREKESGLKGLALSSRAD